MKIRIIFCTLILSVLGGMPSQAEDLQKIPLSAPIEKRGDAYEILGIKLRDPCSSYSLPAEYGGASGDTTSFWSGNVKSEKFVYQNYYVKRTNNLTERVWVQCTSPLTGSVISLIRRSIEYADLKATPAMTKMTEDIVGKYGPRVKGGDDSVLQFAQSVSGKPLVSLPPGSVEPRDSTSFDDQAMEKFDTAELLNAYALPCQADKVRLCVLQMVAKDYLARSEDNKAGKAYQLMLDDLAKQAAAKRKLESEGSAAEPPKL